MEILERVKILLGDTAADEALLNVLIEDSEQQIKEYCHIDSIPSELDNLTAEMTVLKFNRIGTEGLSGRSYSGESESYIEGIPSDIRTRLNSYRKIQVL